MKTFFVVLVACLMAVTVAQRPLQGGGWHRNDAATLDHNDGNAIVENMVEIVVVDDGVEGVMEKDAEPPTVAVVPNAEATLSGDEIAHQFFEEHMAEFEDIDDSVGFNGVSVDEEDDDDASPIPSPYDIPGYSYADTEAKMEALGIDPHFVDPDILEDSFLLVVSTARAVDRPFDIKGF